MATSCGAQLTATRLALVHLQATLPTSSSAKEILSKILSLTEEEKFTEAFCKFNTEVTLCLHDLINAVSKKYRVKSTIKENLWREFHKLRLDTSSILFTSWKELIQSLKMSASWADSDLCIPQQSRIFRILTMCHRKATWCSTLKRRPYFT